MVGTGSGAVGARDDRRNQKIFVVVSWLGLEGPRG